MPGYCNCFDYHPISGRGPDEMRFDGLPWQIRNLIASWFERAWNCRDACGEEVFEPFIYAWIAFNGWAACVTGLDRDSDYLKRLMRSASFCQRFQGLCALPTNSLAVHSAEFAKLWPIFEVKDMRRRG